MMKPKNKKNPKYKINKKFFQLYIIGVSFVALSIVFIALGVVNGIIKNAPTVTKENLQPEGLATIVYDDQGNQIHKFAGVEANRTLANIDEIPEDLIYAFVSIEDNNFFSHKGIDIKGIIRSVVSNITKGDIKASGASTLTQQLIKNNVFKTYDKTFERKIQEQYLAVQLEKEVSKNYILESYLNTIDLAGGRYGVVEGAKYYFNKELEDLTLAECACLAGITKNPTKFNPETNPEDNKERQTLVLKSMLREGHITQSEYDEAIAVDIYATIEQVTNSRKETASSTTSYFVDEVMLAVIDDLMEYEDYTYEDAVKAIYRGGLRIYSTQDSNIQSIVEKYTTDDELYPTEAEGYCVSLEYHLTIEISNGEPKSYNEIDLNKFFDSDLIDDKAKELEITAGEVTAEDLSMKEELFRIKLETDTDAITKELGAYEYIGGVPFFDNEEHADSYIEAFKEAIVSSTDEITSESKTIQKQPQTSFVIMDNETGHVKGISGGRDEKIGALTTNRATGVPRQPGSTFKTLAAYLPALDTGTATLATVYDDVPYQYPGTDQSVRNWYSKYQEAYKGLSTVRYGLSYSINIVTIKTLDDVGLDVAFDYLEKLGFTTLEASDKHLPLAIGGISGVTNEEVTAAYAAIANGGKYNSPTYYTKVTDQYGNIILETEPEEEVVMKETTAWLLTSALESVVTSYLTKGTEPDVQFRDVNMPVVGKTGTTNDTFDTWFAGFTPYYTATIWGGYDRNKTVDNTKFRDTIWRSIMEEIHSDTEKTPYQEFEMPAGITKATICESSGKKPSSLCSQASGASTREEYFASGTEPTETCDVHQEITVCSESGLLPTPNCPTESRVFLVRPTPINEDLLVINGVRKTVADQGFEPNFDIDLIGIDIYNFNDNNNYDDYNNDYQYPEGYCTIHGYNHNDDHNDDNNINLGDIWDNIWNGNNGNNNNDNNNNNGNNNNNDNDNNDNSDNNDNNNDDNNNDDNNDNVEDSNDNDNDSNDNWD